MFGSVLCWLFSIPSGTLVGMAPMTCFLLLTLVGPESGLPCGQQPRLFLGLPSSLPGLFCTNVRAAGNSVLGRKPLSRPCFTLAVCLAVVWFLCGLVTLIPNVWLLVCFGGHAFQKVALRCSLFESVLSIEVDLGGTSSFRSFTCLENVRPHVCLSCSHGKQLLTFPEHVL